MQIMTVTNLSEERWDFAPGFDAGVIEKLHFSTAG